MQLSLFAANGSSNGHVNLSDYLNVENEQLRTLHETMVSYMNNQRRGTSSTLTRGLVSGGGRKPWKQKGTGNARSGSNRSPLWRKGGIIFGPLPRSYSVRIPLEKKRESLRSALICKGKDGHLLVLDSVDSKLSKTSDIAKLVGQLGVKGRALFVVEELPLPLRRAFSNLPRVSCMAAKDISALHVLQNRTVVITPQALKSLSSRISGN